MSAYKLEFEEIARSIFEIRRQSDFFYEQDTIERVIVPVLRLVFGPSLDDITTHMLVRDNRKNRGTGQSADLNIYLNGQLKFAIECKCCRDDFIAPKKDADNKRWKPGFNDKNRENVITKGLGEFGSSQYKKLRDRIGKFIACGLYSSQLHQKVAKVDARELEEALGVIEALWARKIRSVNELVGEQEQFYLTRLCAWQTNPTADLMGQIWRYCQDGLHMFVRGETIPVWTNGASWVFFKKPFYDFRRWPEIAIDPESRSYLDKESKYFSRIDFPSATDMPISQELVAKWHGKLLELQAEFGVTTNESAKY